MLLHQEFVRVAKKNASKLAIIDRTTGRRITYGKALIATLILAEKFQKYEQGFIGIMIPTSSGSALSVLAALMSGRTPVMINYSTGAAANVQYAQRKCAFHTVITSKALLEKINCPVLPGMVLIEDVMASIGAADKLKAALKSKLPTPFLLSSIHAGDPDDNLVILFTSGSEKEPKAVQLTHRNISANVESLHKAIPFYKEDIFLANLPYFHVFGQTANLWVPIVMGMTIVTYANPLDFKAICDIVREEKVTLMCGTPTFFWGYLRKSEPGDFASVRLLLTGADKCPDALRLAFLEKHKKVLLEAYGTTETSPAITVNSPTHNRPGSVGRVLPGVQVRIENYETSEECKIGETGKILCKGDMVMKGYFDDFEETSLHIRHGWYDTGDMGVMDKDGYLWHVGRLRRFVKIGGEMISLIRVEGVLENCLDADNECCVVEVPDSIRGAKIVAVTTKCVDEKAILKKMGTHLPNIALPKQFIAMEELPKMGSGKIDFRMITDRAKELVNG
jgi:acyl-[acyl-carrier-protein]-phospholipid O-acyltransferase / long-chain-fatty-acid--[acyl-carrier-protein] ligase